MAKISNSLTIGRLAKAAQVNIETVRYYQQRKLIPIPPSTGAFRYYPAEMVDRIRFIKRAQELGFTLIEIADLLKLTQNTDRKTVRKIAGNKLVQIEQKLQDLARMQQTLQQLITACEHSRTNQACPIIASLSGDATKP